MEINKYQKSKLYKIIDNTNNNIYIGSTCEPTLAHRLAKHVASYKSYKKGNYNFVSSFKILENADYDIVLIELFPCNSKDELYCRERYWTNLLPCVNTIKNQGKFLELGQVEYSKEYYHENTDKILESKKQICQCECGCTYTKRHKAEHFKTKKHIKLLEKKKV